MPSVLSGLVPVPEIQRRIHVVRGRRVMLDADLAHFYGVTTFNLNKAVVRNLDRFPGDFAFKLTLAETKALIFQTGISKSGRGGVRKPARVFTEQGVAMLAGVLHSSRAVVVSIAIVRAFVELRELLAGHRRLTAKLAELEREFEGHDAAIANLFEAMRQLLEPPDEVPGREIGFRTRLLRAPKKRRALSAGAGRPVLGRRRVRGSPAALNLTPQT